MRDSGLIVITGGAMGLGGELTRIYCRQGRRVVVCGRTESALEEVRSLCPGVVCVRADLATAEGREAFADAVRAQGRPVGLVIHNAAVQFTHDFVSADTPAGRVATEVAVNLQAPIELTLELLPLLLHAGRSRVVFISSALARVPKRSAPVYCATKAGLSNFARALRYQLEGTNIGVTEVVPDLMVTRMTEGRDGRRIAAAEAAEKIVAGLAAEQEEIRLGRVPKLYALHRFLPFLAYRLLKTS